MNKNLLQSLLAKYGDTQQTLANLLGLSLSRTNAKINSKDGAEFTQTEIGIIKQHYNLTPGEINSIFFTMKVT